MSCGTCIKPGDVQLIRKFNETRQQAYKASQEQKEDITIYKCENGFFFSADDHNEAEIVEILLYHSDAAI